MRATRQLCKDLEIKILPLSARHPKGTPMGTCAGNVIELITRDGLSHATFVLRTIVETEGNDRALVADIIGAVSDIVCGHRRWADLGLEWLAAFDQIPLVTLRQRAKAAGARPLRVGLAMLICVELEKILGPSALPKRQPERPTALAA